MRSISRVTDVSLNTVNKLLIDAGNACAVFHAENVVGVKASAFNAMKSGASAIPSKATRRRPEAGSAVVTYGHGPGSRPTSKLIVSWMVGDRGAETASLFIADLQSRLANRVQLTTDGHHAYLDAVDDAFGGDVDYAMLVKLYGQAAEGSARLRGAPL